MRVKFEKGKKYKLTPEIAEYYDSVDDGEDNPCIGYHYAIANGTGKFHGCDCWIVNEAGEVHPGLSESPVPVLVEQLETEIATVLIEVE
jgi:hypothetical protein